MLRLMGEGDRRHVLTLLNVFYSKDDGQRLFGVFFAVFHNGTALASLDRRRDKKCHTTDGFSGAFSSHLPSWSVATRIPKKLGDTQRSEITCTVGSQRTKGVVCTRITVMCAQLQ